MVCYSDDRACKGQHNRNKSPWLDILAARPDCSVKLVCQKRGARLLERDNGGLERGMKVVEGEGRLRVGWKYVWHRSCFCS